VKKNLLEHFPKSVKRFLDKKCGKNKELEQISDSIKSRSALYNLIFASTLLLASPLAAATPDDTLVQAMAIDDIISLDPAEVFEFTSTELIDNSYALLVRFNPDDPASVINELAQDWSVSDDRLTYRFHLREGVKFASGNPVSAHDVAFSFERVVKLNKSPAFLLTQFGLTPENVASKARAVDDLTFELTVDKPYAPSFVMSVMTSSVTAVVDKKLVEEKAEKVEPSDTYPYETDFGTAYLRDGYAGAGVYKIMNWRANEAVVLEANENFFGEAPKLKRVIYRHMRESAGQRLALQAGDVDVARTLEPGDLDAVSDREGIILTSSPKTRINYLSLNQKNEILSQPKVREALKYLVDYEGLEATIIKGIGMTHQNFLPLGQLGALEENPYSLNIEKAKELLKEAGYENGFNISMDVATGQPQMGIAESMQQTFAQAGIKLEILSGDSRQILTKCRARLHDICFSRWGSDYNDPHSNTSVFAANPDNSDDATVKTVAWRSGWDIPELTKQTEAALLEVDTAKRAELYEDIQRQVLADGPYVVILQQIEVAAHSSRVKDYALGLGVASSLVNKTYKE